VFFIINASCLYSDHFVYLTLVTVYMHFSLKNRTFCSIAPAVFFSCKCDFIHQNAVFVTGFLQCIVVINYLIYFLLYLIVGNDAAYILAVCCAQ